MALQTKAWGVVLGLSNGNVPVALIGFVGESKALGVNDNGWIERAL